MREAKRNIRVWLQDGSHDLVGTALEPEEKAKPLFIVKIVDR